jgi:hypothetical protein
MAKPKVTAKELGDAVAECLAVYMPDAGEHFPLVHLALALGAILLPRLGAEAVGALDPHAELFRGAG